MRSLDWVNYLKLRAAYGSVGNDNTAGAYAYYNLYSDFDIQHFKYTYPDSACFAES